MLHTKVAPHHSYTDHKLRRNAVIFHGITAAATPTTPRLNLGLGGNKTTPEVLLLQPHPRQAVLPSAVLCVLSFTLLCHSELPSERNKVGLAKHVLFCGHTGHSVVVGCVESTKTGALLLYCQHPDTRWLFGPAIRCPNPLPLSRSIFFAHIPPNFFLLPTR